MASTINSPDSLNIQTNAVNAISIDASQNVSFTGTITGDGSGLTGLPAGYTDADALSLLNASGSAPVYAARAWVNFNGTGTVAIRASGNVSSITDNGTGNYTVNFTTAMVDTNYSALANAGDGTNYDVFARLNTAGTTYATGSLTFKTSNNGGGVIDCSIVTVSVFR